MVKRSFDFVCSAIALTLVGWLILLAYILAAFDTGKSGFFRHQRVGKGGRLFKVIKIRTMRDLPGLSSTVTKAGDPRITRLGRFFRRTKMDELPQLINILVGDMSFVGPRPDVPGFADRLIGADRIILSVRPGITGPATLKYHNEEEILSRQEDAEKYNDEVIYPDKIKLNREYVENWSFWRDLKYIAQTVCDLK